MEDKDRYNPGYDVSGALQWNGLNLRKEKKDKTSSQTCGIGGGGGDGRR
jgi:hypothetical protein